MIAINFTKCRPFFETPFTMQATFCFLFNNEKPYHQVKERRCMLVPRAMPGPEVKIDKCSVEVGEPQCSEVILQLPRQKCPSKLVSYH